MADEKPPASDDRAKQEREAIRRALIETGQPRAGDVPSYNVAPCPRSALLSRQPSSSSFPSSYVILDEGTRAEIVTPPKAGLAGKTRLAWVRRDGETIQHQAVWDAWRKVPVVRRSAA